MPFKKMYLTLFRETTKAIRALQAAQRRTEESYLEDDTADNLIVLTTGQEDAEQPPEE